MYQAPVFIRQILEQQHFYRSVAVHLQTGLYLSRLLRNMNMNRKPREWGERGDHVSHGGDIYRPQAVERDTDNAVIEPVAQAMHHFNKLLGSRGEATLCRLRRPRAEIGVAVKHRQ